MVGSCSEQTEANGRATRQQRQAGGARGAQTTGSRGRGRAAAGGARGGGLQVSELPEQPPACPRLPAGKRQAPPVPSGSSAPPAAGQTPPRHGLPPEKAREGPGGGGRAGAHRGLREAARGHDQPQQHVVAVRGQRQQPGDAGEGLGRRTPVHRRRLGPARPPQLEGPAARPGTGARTPSTWGRAAPGRPGGARGGRWGRRGRRRAAASGTRGRRARGTGRSSRSPAGPGST